MFLIGASRLYEGEGRPSHFFAFAMIAIARKVLAANKKFTIIRRICASPTFFYAHLLPPLDRRIAAVGYRGIGRDGDVRGSS